MARIAIVGAAAGSLTNFRSELIASMVARGHEVVALAGATDDEARGRIEALGATFRAYPVQRARMNPYQDVVTWRALRVAFSELRPDVVLAYTIKPVVWGGLALRSLRLPVRFYALVTGLGRAFQRGGRRQQALSALVTRLYRSALDRADGVLFQNGDNRREFIDRGIVGATKCVVIGGSGVNLEHFARAPLPHGDVVFLVIARLLGDKGLREFVRAAGLVKKKHPSAEFQVLGPEDTSPDGIPMAEVRAWSACGVTYLGSVFDVRPVIGRCHVYVLPSYHEGLPRTVLEAMAMGRPIVTTDAPGCRETVVPGENGFLVPVKDAAALAGAMMRFIEHPDLMVRMGECSRRLAEQRFDVHRVNEQILRVMRLE